MQLLDNCSQATMETDKNIDLMNANKDEEVAVRFSLFLAKPISDTSSYSLYFPWDIHLIEFLIILSSSSLLFLLCNNDDGGHSF